MLCYLAFGFPPYMAMAMHTDYYVGRDGRQKLRGKQKKSRGGGGGCWQRAGAMISTQTAVTSLKVDRTQLNPCLALPAAQLPVLR